MTAASVYTLRGRITPAERDQSIKMAGIAAGAAFMWARPGMSIRAYKFAVPRIVAAVEMAKLGPGLRGDLGLGGGMQMGVRYGGTGEVTTIGKSLPFLTAVYGANPALGLPFPDIGFGLTSVPKDSSRVVHEIKRHESSLLGYSTRTERIGRSGATSKGPTRTKKTTRQRRRSARRRRQKKWCSKHKRYHSCVYTKQL